MGYTVMKKCYSNYLRPIRSKTKTDRNLLALAWCCLHVFATYSVVHSQSFLLFFCIKEILSDPAMKIILEQMQENPKAAQE